LPRRPPSPTLCPYTNALPIYLPLIWGGLIATAVLLYVVLDGFDLGIGILFPFAPSEKCRDRLMNSVAPFWDGNETWLVLGGGGLDRKSTRLNSSHVKTSNAVC